MNNIFALLSEVTHLSMLQPVIGYLLLVSKELLEPP